VPASDSVKLEHLRITNRGSAPVQLSLTSYVEWTLGADREDTRHQLHTAHDEATGALFARNYYAADFAGRTAFSWISEPSTSYTGRRDHFLGRNGDPTAAAALREEQLSGEVGAGYDPCAAFRCSIALAPGETKVVVLLLGAARSEEEARDLIARHGAPPQARAAIDDATRRWDERLSVISVSTPDAELDALFNRWSLYQAPSQLVRSTAAA
jgi:cyclic beta-1,2-glucan synthetase